MLLRCGACAEHVSGAERIVVKERVAQGVGDLVRRAQKHSKGEADHIVVAVEALDPECCRLRAEPECQSALHRKRAFVEAFLPRLLLFELPKVEASPQSAVLPIIVGSEESAVRVADELCSRGILLSAIRFPSVARVRRGLG